MERIREETHGGRTIVYIDFSGFKSNDEFLSLVEAGKPIISKYAENSIYTITDFADVKYDTATKKIVVDWMMHNKPYVRYAVVIGLDGIKRIMFKNIFALSGRKNIGVSASKEAAIQWLLEQE